MTRTSSIILFVVLALQANAQLNQLPQSYDSLVRKVMIMDLEINTMHNNMVKSHQEFKNGTGMIISGIVFTGLGLAASKTKGSGSIVVIGIAIGTIGSILLIDSHKFIGRAGRRETEPKPKPKPKLNTSD